MQALRTLPYILVLAVALLTACAHVSPDEKPRMENDLLVMLQIKKDTDSTEKKRRPGSSITALVEDTMKNYEGVHFFIYPEGQHPDFTQELKWGENRIFIPKEYLVTGGNFYFMVKGVKNGFWTMRFVPGEENIVLMDVLQGGLMKQEQ